MNRRKVAYISLAAGFITGIILSLTLLKRDRTPEDKDFGPGETVEAFCKAVTAGRFDEARALCDTLTMGDYIRTYAGEWEAQQKKDSCSAAIALNLLSDMTVTVNEIKKENEGRAVFYTIEAGDGMTKRKVASVVKKEGEWKVAEIKDRQ